MTKRETLFMLKCEKLPIEHYYDDVRKLCKRITSDHVIKRYQAIADWVYEIRTATRKAQTD